MPTTYKQQVQRTGQMVIEDETPVISCMLMNSASDSKQPVQSNSIKN
jgi:hypothetical protein